MCIFVERMDAQTQKVLYFLLLSCNRSVHVAVYISRLGRVRPHLRVLVLLSSFPFLAFSL